MVFRRRVTHRMSSATCASPYTLTFWAEVFRTAEQPPQHPASAAAAAHDRRWPVKAFRLHPRALPTPRRRAHAPRLANTSAQTGSARSAIAAQAIWERETRRMSSCLRRAQYAAYATNVNAELPAQQTQATDPPVSSRPHGVIRRERVCSSLISPVPKPRFTQGLVLKWRCRPARRYGILAAQLDAKGPFRVHVTRDCSATSSSNLDAETGTIPVLGVGSPFLKTQGRTESGAEGVTPGAVVTQNSRDDGTR